MTEDIYFEDVARKITITSTSAVFHRKKYHLSKVSAAKMRIRDANRFLRTQLQVSGGLVTGLSLFIFLFQDAIMGALVLLVGVLLILVSLAIRKSQAYSVLFATGKREFEAASLDSAQVAGMVHDAVEAAIKDANKKAEKQRLTPGRHSIE